MPVRIVEGQLPYTGGTGIEIDANKVISLLLREENNLILVNDDNEIYTDLQLASGLTPQSDFPVGVTTGKVLEADGRPQSGLMLNWKTTSGDYARWIYCADGEIYFDGGNGAWRKVYYSSEVDALLQQLRNYVDLNFQPKLTAGAGITIDANNVISAQGAGTGDVSGPASSTDGHLAVFDGTTGKAIKDGGAMPTIPTKTSDLSNDSGFITSSYHDATKQDVLTAGTNIQISASNVISATAGSDIVYATQAEYNALLPGAASDGKHYFIYSTSGGGGWTPGANTVAYYPLDSTNTLNDLSGNNYTLASTHTSPTFGTYQGVDCASFNGSNTELQTASVNPGAYGSNFTVSCWIYGDATGDRVPVCNVYYSATWLNRQIRAHPSWNSIIELNGTSGTLTSFGISANAQVWHNLLFTANGNNITTYVDGVQVGTGTNTAWDNNGTFTIGCGWNEGDGYYGWFKGGLSNVIIENKVWTTQEVSDYYNQTKGDYGIS